MAQEVKELVVQLSPSGTDDTREGLEEVEEQFSETTETAKDSSEILSDFASRMKGAMTVIVAALAAATAGLLSRVPILGEAMGGLMSVVDALGFALDQTLRPALGPLTKWFYEASTAIYEHSDAVGKALVAVLALATGIFGIIGLLAVAWMGNWFGMRDATMTVVNAIRGVIEDFIGFVAPFIRQFLEQVLEGDWVGAFMTVLEFTVTIFDALRNVAIAFFEMFAKHLSSFVADVVTVHQQFWARVRTGFETMFALILNQAKSWANSYVEIVEKAVNKAIQAIPDQMQAKLGLEGNVDIGTPFETQSREEIVAGGRRRLEKRRQRAEQRGAQRESKLDSQIDRLVAEMQSTNLRTVLELDGRQVAQAIEPMLGEGAAGAGRTGSR